MDIARTTTIDPEISMEESRWDFIQEVVRLNYVSAYA